jgi:PAS domain S-box-containing protein
LLGVPLATPGGPLGVLVFRRRARTRFTSRDARLAQALAGPAAVALAHALAFAAQREEAEVAGTLLKLAAALEGLQDVEGVLHTVCRVVPALLGMSRCGLFLLDPATGVLIPAKAWGLAEELRPRFLALQGTPEIPAVVKAVQSLEPVIVEADVLHTLIPGKVATPLDIRAMLLIPLVSGGRLIGVMSVDTPGEVRSFSAAHVAIARGIAAHAASAIDNARLYEETERRRREAEVVADLARAVNACRDLATLLQRVAEGARELCRADLASIGLVDPRSGAVVFHHRTGVRSRQPEGLRVEAGKGLGGRVLVTGRACRTDRYADDPAISKDYLEPVRAEGTVAAMAVPIRSDERIEGLLYVCNRSPRPFADRDEAVLGQLADHAALAIRNAQLFAREQLARVEAEASEQRFRDLVESLDAIVWQADATTRRFSFVSRRAEAILGYPVEQWREEPSFWLHHVHPDDREWTAARCRADAAEGRDHALEYRMVAADGRVVWLRDLVRVLRDPEGQPRQLRGVMVDITERQRMEAELRHSQKMEAIGNLASAVAHDFNNLLTVVAGYSEFLLSARDEQDALRKYVEIKKAVARAASLTRQLVAFGRRQGPQATRLDLNGVVADMAELLRRLLGEDVELQTTLPPGLGPIRADRGQIEQVLMNLAVNAREAMPRGGRLTLETADVVIGEEAGPIDVRPGRYVMLAVGDTGRGIDPETRASLFEPFFTTKAAGEGRGLGLATVYGIVRQGGGHVRVDSEPGHGATFSLYWPRDAEVSNGPADVAIEGTGTPGTATILLVEDEEGVRELTAEILQEQGYAVLVAGDGAEALVIAARHEGPIHLLVTDVVMPRMSGRDLAERLAAVRAETKVLYVSGYHDDIIGRHGVLDAGTAFLQKPFTPESLSRAVRDVLGRPRTS